MIRQTLEELIALYKCGHYSTPLTSWCIDMKSSNRHIVLYMSHLKDLSIEEVKLHSQFAHESKEKLVRLTQENKDYCDKEFTGDCGRIAFSKYFQCSICIDLKECVHKKIWILYLTDSVSRQQFVFSSKLSSMFCNIKE